MAFNPRTYFDANPFSVEDFLNRQRYQVPENQRNYSWAKENFERLWSDIVLTINENTESDNFTLKGVEQIRPFFLGAVVLEKENDMLPSRIIDGQQRLVTLSIIFSVLYEFANFISDPEDRSTLTGRLYPTFTTNIGITARSARIEIGRDNEFYNEFVVQNLLKNNREAVFNSIHESNKTIVKQKIYECYSVFWEKINEYVGDPSGGDYTKKLMLLTRVVLKFLTVLELEVKDESVAYRVFETLNERGLDLTQADLIKNEIIRIADSGGHKSTAVTKWNELEINLSENPEEINNFFRYFYISKYGVIKALDTFDKIRSLINKDTVVEFVNGARIEAELYSKLINTSSEFNSGANEALQNLRLLKITYAYPVLLSALVRFSDMDEFEKAVKCIRDFCFRFLTIGGATPDGLASALAVPSQKLRDNNYSLAQLMNDLHEIVPNAVFVDKFKGFSSKNSATAFYILKSIEDYLAGGQGVQVLSQSYTQHLEHIMPKKPTDGDWAHVKGDERYNIYLDRIGNLLVLEKDINSHIKNKGFSYKDKNSVRKDFQDSVLKLPSLCKNHLEDGKWTFKSINDRQADLANKYITNVWPVVY